MTNIIFKLEKITIGESQCKVLKRFKTQLEMQYDVKINVPIRILDDFTNIIRFAFLYGEEKNVKSVKQFIFSKEMHPNLNIHHASNKDSVSEEKENLCKSQNNKKENKVTLGRRNSIPENHIGFKENLIYKPLNIRSSKLIPKTFKWRKSELEYRILNFLDDDGQVSRANYIEPSKRGIFWKHEIMCRKRNGFPLKYGGLKEKCKRKKRVSLRNISDNLSGKCRRTFPNNKDSLLCTRVKNLSESINEATLQAFPEVFPVYCAHSNSQKTEPVEHRRFCSFQSSVQKGESSTSSDINFLDESSKGTSGEPILITIDDDGSKRTSGETILITIDDDDAHSNIPSTNENKVISNPPEKECGQGGQKISPSCNKLSMRKKVLKRREKRKRKLIAMLKMGAYRTLLQHSKGKEEMQNQFAQMSEMPATEHQATKMMVQTECAALCKKRMSYQKFDNITNNIQRSLSIIPDLRPIVIDGSSIAMAHGIQSGTFSSKGIQISVDFFIQRGHIDVTALVPKFRLHNSQTTDVLILEKLHRNQQVIFIPQVYYKGKRASFQNHHYIVERASKNGGVIVSIKSFRDLVKESVPFKKVIEERLLMFCFVGDVLMIPEDPYGRYGPSLEKFLSFPVCK